ncbi:MAG: hypothetical protein K9J17_04005 [Flavobacteriales bacterium]|nr:hypothetical protein [Flavobacteriales bacterium]
MNHIITKTSYNSNADYADTVMAGNSLAPPVRRRGKATPWWPKEPTEFLKTPKVC